MSIVLSLRSGPLRLGTTRLLAVCSLFVLWASTAASESSRQLLWGDTHLHTAYSFDAFPNGNRSADPDTAGI